MAFPIRRESPLPGLVFLGAGVGTMASFFAGMAREEWEEQSTRINKVVIGMILGFVGGGTGGAFVGAIRHAIWGARDIALFWFTPDVVSQVVTVSLASITGIGFVRLVN